MEKQPLSLPHQKYRNIIFDIGAVLVQWNPQLLVQQLFQNKTTAPYELIQATKSPAWLEFDRGTFSKEELIAALTSSFHIPYHEVALFVEHAGLSLIPLELGSKIFFAAKQQGFRVYLLTNISFYALQLLQTTTSFFKEADGYIASCEVKAIKPEPEIYQHLLQRYNLKPEECLFIDDLEINIKAGNALGIDGIVCQDHLEVIKQLNNQGIVIV